VLPPNSTKKSGRSTKTDRKVGRAMGDISHQFPCQKIRGQGHQAASCRERKLAIIFRTGKPTNFKLGIRMEYNDDSCHRQVHPKMVLKTFKSCEKEKNHNPTLSPTEESAQRDKRRPAWLRWRNFDSNRQVSRTSAWYKCSYSFHYTEVE